MEHDAALVFGRFSEREAGLSNGMRSGCRQVRKLNALIVQRTAACAAPSLGASATAFRAAASACASSSDTSSAVVAKFRQAPTAMSDQLLYVRAAD
jgi:hypothetical protein